MAGTPPRETLSQALSTPARKRAYNQRLFTTIAPRYDLITRVLSYGRDRHWKDRLIELAHVRPGESALDIACGTGDLAERLVGSGAEVTGVDLTPAMLALARARTRARVRWVAGDISSMPLADARFDLVTAGYALRNVPDLDAALGEIARVLRPGGRFVSLDFNRPRHPAVQAAYLAYLSGVGSALGLVLHRDADAYRYIAASLRRYPMADEVVARMKTAGFARARWTPVLAGFMAFHVAER